jgi:hypothetical protein
MKGSNAPLTPFSIQCIFRSKRYHTYSSSNWSKLRLIQSPLKTRIYRRLKKPEMAELRITQAIFFNSAALLQRLKL